MTDHTDHASEAELEPIQIAHWRCHDLTRQVCIAGAAVKDSFDRTYHTGLAIEALRDLAAHLGYTIAPAQEARK